MQNAKITPFSDGNERALPFAWQEFIRFCRQLDHGEIERLVVQDGVPVLAELTKKKVKFARASAENRS